MPKDETNSVQSRCRLKFDLHRQQKDLHLHWSIEELCQLARLHLYLFVICVHLQKPTLTQDLCLLMILLSFVLKDLHKSLTNFKYFTA